MNIHLSRFRMCWSAAARSAALLGLLAGLMSCGGGGGGGGRPEGVYTGFSIYGNLDWVNATGEGGSGEGGVGAGGDGDGGVGAGGDFGQFRNALLVVKYPDGTPVGNGEALTDPTSGMVTIVPRKGYDGPLYLELRGGADATYYEEGKDTFVPFPAGQVIRTWVPRIDKNIGLTPFTEAAYRLLTDGTPEFRAATNIPTPEEIRAANNKLRDLLNQQFPATLAVDDITRLPYIKSPSVVPGQITTNPRGIYGLVNGAFSKQAAMFNATNPAPTLAALNQLGEDILDGKLDGMRDGQPAATANQRTYDPRTLTGELTSALAEQSYRFGTQNAKDLLPKVLNFGTSRYEGYLFDASLKPGGEAVTTVAGWVAEDNLGRSIGSESAPKVTGRVFTVFGNLGHGGVFLKADASNSQSTLYAFGDNVSGELGNGEVGVGTRGSAAQAAVVALPVQAALTHVEGGFAHTVARFADGSVWTWGSNAFGQLGQGADGSTLPLSSTPLRVTLPRLALAVAATNTASYALLEDGSVYSWGSSWGFGLLGDGVKDGVRLSPGPVLAPGGSLVGVVQLAARDNDVIALKQDGSVWTWGSFPSDITGGFVPSQVTLPYNGGSPLPTQITGLPSGQQVRKVMTEQGLFLALLADGSVYHWGVHFDITANTILRDLEPVQVLGLPKARDLMPGGFIGYGARPFDRLTAMAIDYRGNLWKARGRVAEQFDPANPAQQRRPLSQTPRSDCKSCHVVLDTWPLTPEAPASTASCALPTLIHGTLTDPNLPSLVHSDTKCELCHNLNLKTTNIPTGWLNCVSPTNLPVRAPSTLPAVITTACTIPPDHTYTPPGTTCTSCHNSIIARPLQSLTPACAQPGSGLLPDLRTTTTIASAINDSSATIAAGSVTSDATPTLQGSVSAALLAGESVKIRRDGVVIGTATSVGASGWTFTDSGAPDGTRVYTARVESGALFGSSSNSYSMVVDTTAPTAIADVTGVAGDGITIGNGGATSDTTPTISGSLNVPVGAGESVRIERNGSLTGAAATLSGTAWSYTESSALVDGNYSYRARVVDTAGNQGALGAAWTVVINSTLPTATITSAFNDANVVISSGSATTDSTPRLSGTVSAALLAGQTVKVLRDGAPLTGTATVTNGTSWTYTDPGATNGPHNYTARVEQAGLLGQLSPVYSMVIDTVAPTVVANVTSMTDGNLGPVANGGSSSDDTPTIGGTLSAALGASGSAESVQLLRDSIPVAGPVIVSGTTWSYTEPVSLAPTTYNYQTRVIDAAGNLGPLSTPPWSVVIDTTQRTAGITGAFNDSNVLIGAGTPTSDATPELRGTVNATLLPGQTVKVLRNNVALAGNATLTGTSWSYTDPGVGSVNGQTFTYTARVDTGAVQGAQSAGYAFLIDNVAPTTTITVTAASIKTPFKVAPIGAIPVDLAIDATSNNRTDTDNPLTRLALSSPLAAGETLLITRTLNGVGPVTITPQLVDCDITNTCSHFLDLTKNLTVPGPDELIPYSPPNLSLPIPVSYSARVVDAAGNLGPVATKAWDFNYFDCNLIRAQAANGTASHDLAAGRTCSGCHTTNETTPASPTPPGVFARVQLAPNPPAQQQYYWCRRL
jgi:hypothetical protein